MLSLCLCVLALGLPSSLGWISYPDFLTFRFSFISSAGVLLRVSVGDNQICVSPEINSLFSNIANGFKQAINI